jgi:ABC-type Zn uptake system ZnuABC Zn-binding protein ZnuA
MKNMLLLFILANFIALPKGFAAVTIACSHPEICRLAKIVYTENHVKDASFESVIKIVGDPHEYEPSVSEVKALIMAPLLITGPVELNPWIKKVNYQRSKTANIKTINLPLEDFDFAFYPNASHEALSHFWLYPKLFCSLKEKLEKALAFPVTKTCAAEERKVEESLQSTLENIKLPIVLTHDALLPILESLSKNKKNIVAIKGSGHHQETSAKSVKLLYDALKSPKAIWVQEKGINVPQNILTKKRPEDLTINIDTANSDGNSYFQILNELNEKLKAIKI